ncbi:peptidoglycan editing factor PgeF [Brachybacterium sp. AOP25-B2-12]|uniref:peptidoglycan editing factor PgeF n=1 Tax=Brachybacterium sp. AOP25-B2-12 TaxID=3457710 RepID=UPI0040348FCD
MTAGPLVTRAPHLRGARALFTGRAGGVSRAPYDAWNLARHVGDDEADVERNRALLRGELGCPVVFADQVHSADVAVIDEDEDPARVHRVDGLVTRRRDVALAMMVADCLPVLLVDEAAGVVGAAHAGRRGLLGGVLEHTVRAMRDLGARPSDLRAQIGPAICGRCYEVPADMQADARTRLPGIASTTSWGTPALDLVAGARIALTAAGLGDAAVVSGAPCTREHVDYFSYRRDGATGRFAGVIALDPR